jgi:lipopolysaccharide transport system permease protein
MELAQTPASGSLVHTRVAPTHGWAFLHLRELWEYRELLYFLVWRDVQVRYKQTALGVGWAILQPFLTMVVFSAVFGAFAKIPSDGVPYPIFAYAALLPWNYFAGAFSRAGTSLVNSANLISKVYFPRLVIPIAAAAAGLVDFALSFVVLLGMMVFYDIRPTVMIWTLPFFLLLALAGALAVGLWLAALNVRYRDVNYIIPFLVQLWMYASPVAYPSSMIPAQWRMLYGLNPMAGVIEGFRMALLGTSSLDWTVLGLSVCITVVLLISGALYFRRTERSFADVI